MHDALTAFGATCIVVPPSLIPQEAGNPVKTDRIDSAKLASFLSKGLLKAATIANVIIQIAIVFLPNQVLKMPLMFDEAIHITVKNMFPKLHRGVRSQHDVLSLLIVTSFLFSTTTRIMLFLHVHGADNWVLVEEFLC